MIPPPALEAKQREFNAAMARYETLRRYRWTGGLVAMTNMVFQVLLVEAAFRQPLGVTAHLLVILCAFLAADFVNGLVHMVMDNSDNYTSWAGPFIASFHLHHRTPVYRKRNLLLVYILESGSKIWLAAFFVVVTVPLLTGALEIPPAILHGLAYFGVFSCLAEVSHYCCHTVSSPLTAWLAKAGIFLSKPYHARHHLEDNTGYAFLNGATDPALNAIARRFFSGYKGRTDLHYATYAGPGTGNRAH